MKKNKSGFVKNLNVIYKELNGIKVEENDTIKMLFDKFYDIMRKWGICQGEWNGNGRTISNAEWVICHNVFLNKINSVMTLWGLMNDVPEDLQAYEKKAKKIK